jgi:uncharacterized protein with PIN domain
VKARIEFFGNLTDFLDGRNSFDVPVRAHSQIKDSIESLGVPHCEIDTVFRDGQPVSLTDRLLPGDHLQVYPFAPGPPPVEPRFVVDANLGRLKTQMRALGYDCYYETGIDDGRAAEVSARENRILLTKDVGVLMRANVVHGYYVRADRPEAQIREVIRRFDLWPLVRPLSRCVDCNDPIVEIAKAEVLDRLEPLTKKYYDKFFRCPRCGKIYWAGSHVERMRSWFSELEAEFSP